MNLQLYKCYYKNQKVYLQVLFQNLQAKSSFYLIFNPLNYMFAIELQNKWIIHDTTIKSKITSKCQFNQNR